MKTTFRHMYNEYNATITSKKYCKLNVEMISLEFSLSFHCQLRFTLQKKYFIIASYFYVYRGNCWFLLKFIALEIVC